MARIIAARKRERGESEIWSSGIARAGFILAILTESHRTWSRCEGRMGLGFSLDQARDPKQWTIWWGHPRGDTCPILVQFGSQIPQKRRGSRSFRATATTTS